MLDNWLFVGILIFVAIGFAAVPIILNQVIGPKRPNDVKKDTYECGIETVGEPGSNSKSSITFMRSFF